MAEAYYPGITREFLKEYGDRFFIKIHQFFRACLDRTFTREPQALVVGCGGAGKAAAAAARAFSTPSAVESLEARTTSSCVPSA